MKMKSEDPEGVKGMGIWKGIQLIVIAIMVLALFYRYANYVSSRTNIPPGGDPPAHVDHGSINPLYGN
jgi:hypothetical protein